MAASQDQGGLMMRAMILAAGRGERLRPLTDHCPKPLVKVAGKSLIVYHLENLQAAGIKEVVINLGHLGDQIYEVVANGKKWGLHIEYSWESPVLEVGGGICHALPLLGSAPFIVVNGDIWSDYSFSELPQEPKGNAHLVLVDNPSHNLKGDFALLSNQLLYTYSGISVLKPALIADCTVGTAFRLRPLLDAALAQNNLTGEYYGGAWTDVGTLDRLQSLENALALALPLNQISS